MPMTVMITTKVSGRIRGFLASCMCELAPGVYTSPRMNAAVRERVWRVLEGWFDDFRDGSVLMTWPSAGKSGGQEVLSLGLPQVDLVEHDGIYLARRETSESKTDSDYVEFG